MQTPDNFRDPYSMNHCANEDCKLFVPVGVNLLYHNKRCRWNEGKKTALLRKSVSRLHQRTALVGTEKDSMALLIRLTEEPASLADSLDATWQILFECDTLLYRHGPIPEIRAKIKPRVAALITKFVLNPPKTSDEAWQYIQCLKIIIDLGADKRSDVPQLRYYARQVIQYYFEIGDYLHLSKAVLTYAHNWRLGGRAHEERQARYLYKHPFNILSQYRGPHTQEYLEIYHIAKRWYRRSDLLAGKLDEFTLRHVVEPELLESAKTVGTPAAQLEAYCELTGLWAQWARHQNRALKMHEEVEKLQRANAFPAYGRLAEGRSEIHALAVTKAPSDRQKAITLMYEKFLPLYEENRHFYYPKFLEDMGKELGHQFIFSPPTYGSGILVYSPRN